MVDLHGSESCGTSHRMQHFSPYLHSSLLLSMQATPSASARSDALAASLPLHFMQAAPSASARSDALAASSPLHFMQATPSAPVRIGPTNSISVNFDDPGSADGGKTT
ncbi:hypothetical protein T492DRAFT_914382 [Pavlovales sp. CCMP2436]|nr:hypothetical protein T492DRAFT_914382 [Pavlovales sp. CCMP2436]